MPKVRRSQHVLARSIDQARIAAMVEGAGRRQSPQLGTDLCARLLIAWQKHDASHWGREPQQELCGQQWGAGDISRNEARRRTVAARHMDR